MNADHLDEFKALPQDVRGRIMEACERFEFALGSGEPARAEDYRGPPGPGDTVLLRELLLLECDYRRRRGNPVGYAELVGRFPGKSGLVVEVVELADRYARTPESGGLLLRDGSPAVVGRYRLLRELGRGGFGIVFLAIEIGTDKEVAVKVPHAAILLTPGLRDWFVRETHAVAALSHPNIVRVFESGNAGLVCYLATEYVSGPSLAGWLVERRGPAPPAVAVELLRALAGAVQHAHDCGVIHRDLKPANVLLVAGNPRAPKLTDFGLARMADAPALSHTGVVVGTPAYMAPEQAAGRHQDVSPRTDVYALGGILYELLTGQSPFVGGTFVDVLRRVMTEEPVRPRSLASDIPPELQTICLKCLEKEPVRRYASAADLAADLGRWSRGEAVLARRVGPLGRGRRWCRRNPMVATLAAGLALAVVCGLSAALWLWRQAEDSAEQAKASLRHEEEARREAEDRYVRLRAAMLNCVVSASPTFTAPEPSPTRATVLQETEAALEELIARWPEDVRLRAMLARVLTQLGAMQHLKGKTAASLATFRKAVDLWGRLPEPESRTPQYRPWQAVAYSCLEQVYEQTGRDDEAQRCFAVAMRLWKELIQQESDLLPDTDNLFFAAVNMRWLVVGGWAIGEDCGPRLRTIRARLDRMGGEDSVFFFDLFRLVCLGPQAHLHLKANNKAELLGTAREASIILSDILRSVAYPRSYRLAAVSQSLTVSVWLRRAEAYGEALLLSDLANRTVRDLLRQSPDDHTLLVALSQSWHAHGKIHWELRQFEDALVACRSAADAQRRALALAPASAADRDELGWRLIQLGRKLCELGRLDEAEASFADRQALWPGDPERHAEAVRELRKWAAELGENKAGLSPEASRQRQRYLDLYSRLERKNTTVPVTAKGQP